LLLCKNQLTFMPVLSRQREPFMEQEKGSRASGASAGQRELDEVYHPAHVASLRTLQTFCPGPRVPANTAGVSPWWAAEVRSLAQRSAVAAKKIKTLIDDSVGHVDNGSKNVEEAGQIVREVVSSISHVTAIVGEMSTSSQYGIEQINRAVTQVHRARRKTRRSWKKAPRQRKPCVIRPPNSPKWSLSSRWTMQHLAIRIFNPERCTRATRET
jgi:Methyl-accepting chemotaxis protein (MCP) signalling domain